MKLHLAGVFFFLWLIHPIAAHATDDQVVILRVGEVNPSMREAVARMQGELAAAGFTSLVLDAQVGTNVTDEINAINRVVRPAATFALQAQSGVAEVWFADRRLGQHVSQRIDLANEPPARVPLVVAVRAAEFLRGHLSSAPATPAPGPMQVRVTPQAPRWSLGLCTVVLAEEAFKVPAVAPGARAALRLSPRFSLDVMMAGAGSAIEIEGPQGKATVHRQIVAAGGRFHRHLISDSLGVFTGAAAALHHLSGSGTASSGFANAKDALWAPAGLAELGIRYEPTKHIWTELAVAVSATLAKAHVRFGDESQQQFGRPSLLAGLCVGVML